MTTEPQRLQYLEAMGLTAWTARYRLPNARATEACDWALPVPEEGVRQAPGARLHALLESPAEATPAPPASEPKARQRPPAGSAKARALLGDIVPGAEGDAGTGPAEGEAATPGAEAQQEPLRFSLQVACLDGRWLVILPREAAPGVVELRLLANLLRAAGVVPEKPPAFEAFHWPQVEGLPVQAPLEEAGEGLQAFLAGRRRRGWAPERLLIFGEGGALAPLLALQDGHCPLLDLPAWQGPALTELAGSAAAKRALWPSLADWRRAWLGEPDDA
ncbi:hypothetical protein [Halomonas nitroreducens]|uniref:Uncharacterized protein n=1 Tax=Halomonas nitroreducens TaxID=447425 RepID=A0A3S0HSE0_9GAMM|nr:hypothetical protein [Halomonas nitroreducens]RTR03369.1 hypothetical protein EKG36_10610 [Halomonas nitroreducens]